MGREVCTHPRIELYRLDSSLEIPIPVREDLWKFIFKPEQTWKQQKILLRFITHSSDGNRNSKVSSTYWMFNTSSPSYGKLIPLIKLFSFPRHNILLRMQLTNINNEGDKGSPCLSHQKHQNDLQVIHLSIWKISQCKCTF